MAGGVADAVAVGLGLINGGLIRQQDHAAVLGRTPPKNTDVGRGHPDPPAVTAYPERPYGELPG